MYLSHLQKEYFYSNQVSPGCLLLWVQEFRTYANACTAWGIPAATSDGQAAAGLCAAPHCP